MPPTSNALRAGSASWRHSERPDQWRWLAQPGTSAGGGRAAARWGRMRRALARWGSGFRVRRTWQLQVLSQGGEPRFVATVGRARRAAGQRRKFFEAQSAPRPGDDGFAKFIG